MNNFEIVAHRGVTDEAPENTLLAFERAIELGADAVELDVRLTADRIPVVFHYYYLENTTPIVGPIFNYKYEELKQLQVRGRSTIGKISTFPDVLDAIGGQIGLEVEIKGPEPESAVIVAGILREHKRVWQTMEITSYEPALLLEIRKQCPGLATDLLFSRSQPWMKLDVVAYQALHQARLAQARAVHLHPTQLSQDVVAGIKQNGIEVHAWDVNDEKSLQIIAELEVPRICTDNFQQAFDFRKRSFA